VVGALPPSVMECSRTSQIPCPAPGTARPVHLPLPELEAVRGEVEGADPSPAGQRQNLASAAMNALK
jgi:hypothetical protein